MSKTLSISEARGRLGYFARKVQSTSASCVISTKGSPLAVLVGIEEYESWQATLDVLEDRQELADIQQGIAELKSGQTVSFEEVFGEPIHGAKAKRS